MFMEQNFSPISMRGASPPLLYDEGMMTYLCNESNVAGDNNMVDISVIKYSEKMRLIREAAEANDDDDDHNKTAVINNVEDNVKSTDIEEERKKQWRSYMQAYLWSPPPESNTTVPVHHNAIVYEGPTATVGVSRPIKNTANVNNRKSLNTTRNKTHKTDFSLGPLLAVAATRVQFNDVARVHDNVYNPSLDNISPTATTLLANDKFSALSDCSSCTNLHSMLIRAQDYYRRQLLSLNYNIRREVQELRAGYLNEVERRTASLRDACHVLEEQIKSLTKEKDSEIYVMTMKLENMSSHEKLLNERIAEMQQVLEDNQRRYRELNKEFLNKSSNDGASNIIVSSSDAERTIRGLEEKVSMMNAQLNEQRNATLNVLETLSMERAEHKQQLDKIMQRNDSKKDANSNTQITGEIIAVDVVLVNNDKMSLANEEDIRRLLDENDALKNRLLEQDSEWSQLFNSTQCQLHIVKQDAAKYQAAQKHLQENLSAMQQELAVSQHNCELLKNQLSVERNKVETTTTTSRCYDISAKPIDTSSSSSSSQQHIEKFTEENKQLKEKLKELTDAAYKQTRQLQLYKGQINEMRSLNEKHAAEKATAADEIVSLKHNMELLRAKALAVSRVASDAEIASVTSRCGEPTTENADIVSAVIDAVGGLQAISESGVTDDDVVKKQFSAVTERLTKTLRQSNDKLQRVQMEMHEAVKEKTLLQNEVVQLQAKCAKLQEDNTKLTARVSHEDAIVERTKAAIELYKRRIDDLTQQINSLRQANSELTIKDSKQSNREIAESMTEKVVSCLDCKQHPFESLSLPTTGRIKPTALSTITTTKKKLLPFKT